MNNFPLAQEAQRLAKEYGFTHDATLDTWRAPRGKFEGEVWYAPYYFNAMLEGDGENIYANEDAESPEAVLFQVDGEEAEAFDLECGAWVLLREDSQGFVLVTDHETREQTEKRFSEWIGG